MKSKFRKQVFSGKASFTMHSHLAAFYFLRRSIFFSQIENLAVFIKIDTTSAFYSSVFTTLQSFKKRQNDLRQAWEIS